MYETIIYAYNHPVKTSWFMLLAGFALRIGVKNTF